MYIFSEKPSQGWIKILFFDKQCDSFYISFVYIRHAHDVDSLNYFGFWPCIEQIFRHIVVAVVFVL